MSDDLSIPNAGYRGNQVGRYGTRQSRRRGMDPDARRLVMFASGVGAVLVALVAASTLIGHHSTEIPVIAADSHPIRVRPDNPGGMKIDGAENDVFSAGSDTANARLAPPAEKPDARALHTVEAPHASVVALPSSETAILPPRLETKPAVVTTAPAAKPDPVMIALPPAAAVEASPPASFHQAIVQLAALTSEEAARNEWQQLARRMPDLLNGRQPNFSRIERDGQTFWRVRTSGFADRAQARTFCAHVRAKGGDCSVADF